jgi:hypothetical protein
MHTSFAFPRERSQWRSLSTFFLLTLSLILVACGQAETPNATTAYPISGYSFVIVYQQQDNADKGWSLANLFWWMVHDGQQYAVPLNYAALPDTMVVRSEAQIRAMTCGSSPCYKG